MEGFFIGVFMYDKFMDLKKNKKWLFYLLIIPFLIAAAIEFYNRYIINSSKKIIKKTKDKDKELEIKQKEAEKEADKAEKEADDIENKINNIKVNKDWHKK